MTSTPHPDVHASGRTTGHIQRQVLRHPGRPGPALVLAPSCYCILPHHCGVYTEYGQTDCLLPVWTLFSTQALLVVVVVVVVADQQVSDLTRDRH